MVINNTSLLFALRDIYREFCFRDGKAERKVQRLCQDVLGPGECKVIKETVRIERQRRAELVRK